MHLVLYNKKSKEAKIFENCQLQGKADDINYVAEARQIEKEFRFAKKFSIMYQRSSKIYLPKIKSPKHLKRIIRPYQYLFHLNLKILLINPYLTDSMLPIDETAHAETELENVISKIKCSKSRVTDNISA